MIKKLLLTAGLALVLAFGLMAGRGTVRANPGPGLQNFNVDMTQCLVPSLPDGVSPDPLAGPYQNCLWGSEAKGLGPGAAGSALGTSIGLIAGNRLGYPYVYNGPNLVLMGNEIPDLTQVGDVISVTDIFQNNVVDVMADSTNCSPGDCAVISGTKTQEAMNLAITTVKIDDNTGLASLTLPAQVMVENEAMTLTGLIGDGPNPPGTQQDTMTVTRPAPVAHATGLAVKIGSPVTFATAIPEQYIKKGPFTTTSGCLDKLGAPTDETYMNALMPGAGMTWWVRYQACINTLFLGGWQRFDVVANTGVESPLNLVTFSPNWSPVGTHVNLVVLSQLPDHLSPNTALLGLDTPQSSKSHVYAPYADNPGAAGLYVMWITEISAPDVRDGALNFVLSTSCKTIGPPGTIYTDADNDCLAQEANPGSPGVTDDLTLCTGDPDGDTLRGDADADSDNDGLLDGVEVAWGSDPCDTDTDNDGRTDLEEMIGPTQFLTDPTMADTDGDTVPDGGLKVDLHSGTGCPQTGIGSDGKPDFPDENGDGICDAGMSADQDNSADGSSHVRTGYKIVGKDISPDNASSVTVIRAPGTGSADDVEITLTHDAAVHIGLVTAGNAAIDCPVLNGVMTASVGLSETWTVKWGHPCDVEPGQSINIKVFWYHELGTDLAPELSAITWTAHMGLEPDPNAPLPATVTRTVAGDSAEDVQITLLRDPLLTKITGVTAGGGTSGCPVLGGVKVASGPNTETWWVQWATPCVEYVAPPNPYKNIVIAAVSTGPGPILVGVEWSKLIGSQTGPFNTLSPRPETDNCPTIPNDQVNTDLDSATTLGAGDVFGDACDLDDDNDEIVDAAEATFKWDPTAKVMAGPTGLCGNVPPMTGTATPLNPKVADTDGDGILDGVECKMGSNPNNATDVPLPCSVGPLGPRDDADSDLLCASKIAVLPIDDEELHWRTQGISGYPALNPPAGDTNANSDSADLDTLTDGCEVMIAGTEPMNPDSDGDTVLDNNEAVGASAGTPGHNACSAPTIEYGEIGNGTGVAAADTSVPNASGGRTADTDKDGLLNYLDADPGGDITYDDNNDGAMMSTGTPDDDGPSWDVNADGILDGWLISCGSATADADGDGLKDAWENCKWGTNPSIVDSDGDGIGDCTEAVDTNGNGIILGDFGGDGLNSARATLLPAGVGTGKFGKDGDFDLNGNMLVAGDFGADTLTTARMTLGIWVCQ